MKKKIKEPLEKIVSCEINNEFHALILLELKLIELGGESFIESCFCIKDFIDMIVVFGDGIYTDHLDSGFWNALILGENQSRKGPILNPKLKKNDSRVLKPVAEAIIKMQDTLRYAFTIKGITIIHQDNQVICSLINWRKIEGSVRDFSCEVIFNQIKKLDLLKELISESLADDKEFKRYQKAAGIKYFCIDEIIELMSDNNLIKNIC